MNGLKAKYLKSGDKVLFRSAFGSERLAEFVRRIPPWQRGGRSAVSIFIVPDYAGLNGPTDKGFAEFSDRDVKQTMKRTTMGTDC
jgi:hypothetical protein